MNNKIKILDLTLNATWGIPVLSSNAAMTSSWNLRWWEDKSVWGLSCIACAFYVPACKVLLAHTCEEDAL